MTTGGSLGFVMIDMTGDEDEDEDEDVAGLRIDGWGKMLVCKKHRELC